MSRTLSDWEIEALKDKARMLDIRSGGHCDARSGAINFWSSPDNCPPGQESLTYLEGNIGYPRNFIGTVTLYDLSVSTTNYERMRAEHGPTGCYGAAAEPYVNQPEDVAWVREQWRVLWRAALPGIPPPELAVKEIGDE